MSDKKIVQIVKREPTRKEIRLAELIRSIKELQAFLVSINRQGDLWEIFNTLCLFVGACMRESEGEQYEDWIDSQRYCIMKYAYCHPV